MAAGKLSLYQAKRDFTKTAEPSGQARVKPAEYPRFVIQKHAALTSVERGFVACRRRRDGHSYWLPANYR
jgi:hypothetical protein